VYLISKLEAQRLFEDYYYLATIMRAWRKKLELEKEQ
jgi:hypothetical protein